MSECSGGSSQSLRVLVTDPSGQLRALPPTQVSSYLARRFNVCSGRRLSHGVLELTVPTQRDFENFQFVKKICGVPVEISCPTPPCARGVIRGVHRSYSTQDLETHFASQGVEKVRFLLSRRYAETPTSIPPSVSRTVLLTFEGDTAPATVTLGFESYCVSPYNPPPRICYHCERFGHVAAVCRHQKVCSHCSGAHGLHECPNLSAAPHCNNCKLAHSTRDRNCSFFRVAAATVSLMRARGLRYAAARRLVFTPPEHIPPPFPAAPSFPHPSVLPYPTPLGMRPPAVPCPPDLASVLTSLLQVLQRFLPDPAPWARHPADPGAPPS